jgi:hypothetical protein
MNRLIVLLATVLAFSPEASQAQPQPQTNMTMEFGIGRLSCANWNNLTDGEGNAWILGYWAGMNIYSDNHLVGHLTDGLGILAEVRLLCRQHPSMPILQAANTVYLQIAAREAGQW